VCFRPNAIALCRKRRVKPIISSEGSHYIAASKEDIEPKEMEVRQTILIFRIMKLVPPERQNDLLMLLIEMKRDMEMLSLEDFVEKWQIREDE
jgi:hypothetical protein